MNGIDQRVCIRTDPTYATVYVDGVMLGQTPVYVTLPRRSNHCVRVERQGYYPFQMVIGRKVSHMAYLDGWCSGPFGVIFDAGTGGAYKLHPRTVNIELMEMPIEEDNLE